MKYYKLIENAGKPKGFWGNLMINSMNKGHIEVTDWGLKYIEIENTDKILDVGCGGGKTVFRIAEKVGNGKVFGIDYSDLCVKRSIELNKKNILCNKVKIQKASVDELPFKDNTFDKVTAIETMYFWKDKVAGLKEILRVLKPNGKVLLVFEMLYDEKNPNKWVKVEKKLNIKSVKENEIFELLAESGFVEINVFTEQKNNWICVVAEKL